MHQKILELKNKVGYRPIYYFKPSQTSYEAKPIEQRSAKTESDTREIKQYFCIFGVPDDYGMVPIKGCFAKSLNERGPNSKASYKITVLNQHDQKNPLCLPSVLKEDEIGLYGEYTPDEGIQSNDDLVTRVKKGTINNGSYGFNYDWNNMEYDDVNDLIICKSCFLFEVSPVTIGSQTETFVVRNQQGIAEDETLEDDTERIIRRISRADQLELRSIINRHISLAKLQPLQDNQKALDEGKSKHEGLDLDYILKNL